MADRSCNPLLWQKLYPAESLTIKDSTVTRNGIVLKLLPLSNAEAASAEVSEYLRISSYRVVTREA